MAFLLGQGTLPTLASSNYGYKWDAFQRGRGGPRNGGRGPTERRHYKTAAKPPPPPSEPSHRRCVQRLSRIRGSRAAANHQNANQALWHRKVNLAHRHPSLPDVLRPAFRPGGDVRRDLHPARPVLPPDGPLSRRRSHDGRLHRARPRRAAPAGLASL